MQRIVLSATPVGTTGSATATSTSSVYYSGNFHAVYFDSVATTASTVMRVAQVEAPSQNYISVNSTADGWYFPRNAITTNAGGAVTGTSAPYPVTGRLAFTVSTSVPAEHIAYIYIEEQ